MKKNVMKYHFEAVRNSDIKLKQNNGVIQLEINPRISLNIYLPEGVLKHKKIPKTIYCQEFSSDNEVLLGEVIHTHYKADYSGNKEERLYSLYKVGLNNELSLPEYKTYKMSDIGRYKMIMGGMYWFPKYEFYSVSVDNLTATLTTKTSVDRNFIPKVAYETWYSVNTPEQQLDEAVAWAYVEKVFEKINHIEIPYARV